MLDEVNSKNDFYFTLTSQRLHVLFVVRYVEDYPSVPQMKVDAIRPGFLDCDCMLPTFRRRFTHVFVLFVGLFNGLLLYFGLIQYFCLTLGFIQFKM